MSTSEKIRRILKHVDWTQQDVAQELGVAQSTVNRWLKGAEPEGPNRDALNALYEKIFGESAARFAQMVPLIGYVGAGAEEHRYEDLQGELGRVEAPLGSSPDTVAVEVRGDSLGPFFENALIFYDERHDPPTDRIIGDLCVVGLVDGRVLVKQIRRGSRPGLWTLHAQFGSPIEDVEIAWAARVCAVVPRPRG